MSEFVELFLIAQEEAVKGRDSDILDLRYGFTGLDAHTLQEIGDIYNLTRERIRQILNRAHRRMLSIATREIKKGNVNHPCAMFVQYLRENLKSDDDDETIGLIANFIVNELDFIPTGTHAVPLITYFIGGKAFGKQYTKQITKRISKDKKALYRQQKQEFKLNKLLETIIWTSEPVHWDINKLKQLESSRNVGESDISGTFYSSKLAREVSYESGLELKYLQKLEDQDAVIYYLEQPFNIAYKFREKTRKYYPDIFFLLSDGRGIVVEIKSAFQMGLQTNLVKWKALREYCTEKGLGIIVTDGSKSIQEAQHYPVREEVIKAIFPKLQQNCLTWSDYQIIRDELDIKRNEFIAMILQHRLHWELKPFSLCLPE